MRCNRCGFKVRGKSHEKGEHHKKGVWGLLDPIKIQKMNERMK